MLHDKVTEQISDALTLSRFPDKLSFRNQNNNYPFFLF